MSLGELPEDRVDELDKKLEKLTLRVAKLAGDTVVAVRKLEAEYKALEMRMFEMSPGSEFFDQITEDEDIRTYQGTMPQYGLDRGVGAVDLPARQMVAEVKNYIEWASNRLEMVDQYLMLTPSEPMARHMAELRDTLYLAIPLADRLSDEVEALEKGKEE